MLLRIAVNDQPSLEDRVVGKIDAGHHVGRAEGDLLHFGKFIVDVPVQRQFADFMDGDEFFRPEFCRVENVEIVLEFVFHRDELHAEFKFRIIALVDGLAEVSSVEVRVDAAEFDGLVLKQGVHPEYGLPHESYKRGDPSVIDKQVRIDGPRFHHPVAS